MGFIGDFLDALEQSSSRYEQKFEARIRKQVESELEKNIDNLNDKLILDLSLTSVNQYVIKSHMSPEWLMNDFYGYYCSEVYRFGFLLGLPDEVVVDKVTVQRNISAMSKEVRSKIIEMYADLGRAEAEEIAICFTDTLDECVETGRDFGNDYPVYEYRRR